MAWERRGSSGNKYGYRSVRTENGVKKEYLGTGSLAREHAEQLDRDRARRIADEAAIAEELRATMEARQLTLRLEEASSMLLKTSLFASGFWRGHNYGPWRKRRGLQYE